MEERPINDHSYEQFLAEEQLMGSRCAKCDALYAPPRSICTNCYASDMRWEAMQGTGTLAAFTCIAIGPSFMASEGFGRENPYCTGAVRLAEGPRLVARIEGVDAKSPETIRIGTPMRVKYLHRGDVKARAFVAFEPCE